MNKSELRKIYLARQKDLIPSERKSKSLRVYEQFFEHFDLDDVRYLHLFLSIAKMNELNTYPFINDLWGDWINIKTIVPRVDLEKNNLEHVEFHSDSKIKVSDWGIPEPIGDELVDEKKLDLVLVPLLCFDKKGFRVGYGKGFYDKFLIKCREDCLKIGLSLFGSVEQIEDVKNFDVKLDYCITPQKIWQFR